MFSVWFAGLFSVRQQNYGPSFHNILGKETPWVKEKISAVLSGSKIILDGG